MNKDRDLIKKVNSSPESPFNYTTIVFVIRKGIRSKV